MVAGSEGDGRGMVWVAHAWCPDEHRKVTVGFWHWWNVYKDEQTARMQALRRSRDWKEHGQWEVIPLAGQGRSDPPTHPTG
jgi:hypothetical protein